MFVFALFLSPICVCFLCARYVFGFYASDMLLDLFASDMFYFIFIFMRPIRVQNCYVSDTISEYLICGT